MKRLFLYILMFLSACVANAQGFPFIKNYTPDDYHAHNRNFDVVIGNDGIVYIANFEGVLYYDKAKWDIIHTPGITRVTVLFRDSKDNIWCGGYNYFGKIQQKHNGEICLQRVGDPSTFKGEVIEISETEGKIVFLVDNGYIYQVDGNDKLSVRKQISSEHLQIGLSDVVDIDKLDQNQAVVLSDITQEMAIGNGLTAAIKKVMASLSRMNQARSSRLSLRLTVFARTALYGLITTSTDRSGELQTMASFPLPILQHSSVSQKAKAFPMKCCRSSPLKASNTSVLSMAFFDWREKSSSKYRPFNMLVGIWSSPNMD